MSKIHDIPERRRMSSITLSQCVRYAVDACCDAGLNDPPSTDAALAAGVQLYRLEHWLNDRDAHDEQMSGIAGGLENIGDDIRGLTAELEKTREDTA